MKILFNCLLIVVVLLAYSCTSKQKIAQVVIHTNQAPFVLSVSGKQINHTPDTYVCVTNLKPRRMYQLRKDYTDGKKSTRKEVALKPKKQTTWKIIKIPVFGYQLKKERTIALKKIDQMGVAAYDYQNLTKQQVDSLQPQVVRQTICKEALPKEQFEESLAMIKGKATDQQKLIVLDQFLVDNCFHTEQVEALTLLLEDEKNRLNILLKAYPTTLDTHQYYLLNNVLSSNKAITRFNRFLSEQ